MKQRLAIVVWLLFASAQARAEGVVLQAPDVRFFPTSPARFVAQDVRIVKGTRQAAGTCVFDEDAAPVAGPRGETLQRFQRAVDLRSCTALVELGVVEPVTAGGGRVSLAH